MKSSTLPRERDLWQDQGMANMRSKVGVEDHHYSWHAHWLMSSKWFSDPCHQPRMASLHNLCENNQQRGQARHLSLGYWHREDDPANKRLGWWCSGQWEAHIPGGLTPFCVGTTKQQPTSSSWRSPGVSSSVAEGNMCMHFSSEFQNNSGVGAGDLRKAFTPGTET